MGKKLVIAEKPSVAADIARALGGMSRKAEYFENDDYIVSSAVGHLLELVVPEDFDVKKGKWTFKHLPVIPPHFELSPIERSAKRLQVLLKLMRRKDVSSFVNACDAGREGELIFRYLVQHSGATKPIERLWLQSMTAPAIREGFQRLRPDQELMPLADAARCRSEADWLVGINGTRAMTAFNSKEGGFYLTTVGRVQTPTLAILIEREERIRAFVARDYWEVHAVFGAKAGDYAGRWFDPGFSKEEDAERRPERIWQAADAERIVAACTGKKGTVSEETKPATQISPPLFDLTSLQREANGRFGFSAKSTLALAQALYERHKVLTYPRTDSRALPEDYLGTVKKTMEALSSPEAYGAFAKRILKGGWVKPNRRIFDDTKISDHFAIIPTLQTPGNLSEAEQKLYDLVVRRFLAVFYPAAQYLQTTRITTVLEHQFRTEGRVLVDPGWLAVYGRSAEESSASLPPITSGESVAVREIEARAEHTKPPARYTEATLLSAMEGAGKLVEDDDLRAAMGSKGLGTPATRAAIIEGLLKEEYIHREGRELVPTPKAFSLLFALHMLGIVELASPELTGEWEHKLKLIERGELTRAKFMQEIRELVKNVVAVIKNGEIPDVVYATVPAPCPRCGGKLQENYRKFQCQQCDFSLWKVISGREWSPDEVAELVTKRFVGPLTGFRSRIGKPFAAAIRLNEELRTEFDFGQPREGEAADAAPDFTGQESLGSCPKCSARVFEHGVAYVCEKATGPSPSCDFRSGKIILQQPVERAQMQKLLATGKTDLFTRFISRKGRPFKAYLVKTADGKVGFEFVARPKRPAAGEAAPASAQPAKAEVRPVKRARTAQKRRSA
ncbi:MAG TPA: DNA topoisomerase III [Burkholderiales bacterium]|nr:DNA topoisomerase III [Burkholderiales bacterium]